MPAPFKSTFSEISSGSLVLFTKDSLNTVTWAALSTTARVGLPLILVGIRILNPPVELRTVTSLTLGVSNVTFGVSFTRWPLGVRIG